MLCWVVCEYVEISVHNTDLGSIISTLVPLQCTLRVLLTRAAWDFPGQVEIVTLYTELLN